MRYSKFWMFCFSAAVVAVSLSFLEPASNNTIRNAAAARLAMMSITMNESRRHVQHLAAVEFRGREAGTDGERRAAKYIAREFSRYGLQPAGDDGGYFQNFQLERSDLKEATLQIAFSGENSGERREFSLIHDFTPFNFSGENSLRANVAFAGYGITAPEYGYDDYENLDVTGKIVLALRHEPREHDPNSIFDGTQLTRHALFEEKAKNAQSHGAVAMLLVSDPAHSDDNLQPQSYWPGWHGKRLLPKPWQLQKNKGLDTFPAIWVDVRVAEKILTGAGQTLLELHRKIDLTGKPQSFNIAGPEIYLRVDLDKEVRRAQNVIAMLRGSDPELADEAVVVGAHFDHVGVINERIYPGADDNASGIAGLLEIAEGFSELSGQIRRSVLFIAFSAEEMGLLGSEFYVNNPVFPPDNMVTMINLDMIGRNAENEVTVVGSRRSPELHEINHAANREIGLQLNYNGEHFFNRSDQANFAKFAVPVIFYNTDSHADYHRPTDTAEKINPDKVARIARLAFLVAWEVANSDVRPSYVGPKLYR